MKDYKKQISSYSIQALKELNNTYISIQVILPSLLKGKIEIEKLDTNQYTFSVPSTKKDKIRELPRTKEKYIEIIQNALEFDLFKYFIITTNSITEDFIISVLRVIFRSDPRKLLLNLQGIEIERNIPLKEIILATDKAELISNKIEQHMTKLLYQEPKKLFDYLELLNIKIDSEEIGQFCEIKATRDLLVHNSGIINKTYLKKAGEKSRGEINSKIMLNKEYIENCLRYCKKVVGRITRDSKKLV